jgi:organic hydroperoxide reductase OsmC/OhrA
VASIALETSKIGLASTLVNSAADEDRSRSPRSARCVRREPLNEGARALTLRAKVPNLDDAAFARIAGEAEKNCPVSKVLNATITLDAKLVP